MQLLKVISFKIVCYLLCQVSLHSVINLTVVDSLIPRYKVQGKSKSRKTGDLSSIDSCIITERMQFV